MTPPTPAAVTFKAGYLATKDEGRATPNTPRHTSSRQVSGLDSILEGMKLIQKLIQGINTATGTPFFGVFTDENTINLADIHTTRTVTLHQLQKTSHDLHIAGQAVSITDQPQLPTTPGTIITIEDGITKKTLMLLPAIEKYDFYDGEPVWLTLNGTPYNQSLLEKIAADGPVITYKMNPLAP